MYETEIADTEWEYHRSLETHSTSFEARIHSHSVWFEFSIGRLWWNCWRKMSLSCEILFFEARFSWNVLCWRLDHSQSSLESSKFWFYVKLQTEKKLQYNFSLLILTSHLNLSKYSFFFTLRQKQKLKHSFFFTQFFIGELCCRSFFHFIICPFC